MLQLKKQHQLPTRTRSGLDNYHIQDNSESFALHTAETLSIRLANYYAKLPIQAPSDAWGQ